VKRRNGRGAKGAQGGGDVEDKGKEERPAPVPEKAKQAGETGRWGWVEPSVWTPRMLEALDKGVKGGKWFSLIDKLANVRALEAAFVRVKANKGSAGVDHQTIGMFERRREANLESLVRSLTDGTYAPSEIRRVWIPKPGKSEKRPLGIPTVRDRVVQTALRAVLEPIFERDFSDCSFGFRPGRGCKTAIRRAVNLRDQGHHFVVDADIKGYFDTIDHKLLLQRIEEKVADGRVLNLVESFLKQRVLSDTPQGAPEEGTPQGAVVSPLLSNIYLDDFDKQMTAAGYSLVRYADDWVILCRTRAEAEAALEAAKTWMESAKLTLHPEKTRIVDLTDPKASFDFLGYRLSLRGARPSDRSRKRLKDKLKPLTQRNNGHSMEVIVKQINVTLRGWYEYFKNAHYLSFPPLDAWVRGRLRGILRKRHGRKGRAAGNDHQRYPNTYFATLGLFSMSAARAVAFQSSTR